MYRVECSSEWFVVDAPNIGAAYSEGVKEWGRGSGIKVSKATKEDIDYITAVKGRDALRYP